jgi:hypothetical protein
VNVDIMTVEYLTSKLFEMKYLLFDTNGYIVFPSEKKVFTCFDRLPEEFFALGNLHEIQVCYCCVRLMT